MCRHQAWDWTSAAPPSPALPTANLRAPDNWQFPPPRAVLDNGDCSAAPKVHRPQDAGFRDRSVKGSRASDRANPAGVGVAMRAGHTKAKSSATSRCFCSLAARAAPLGAPAAKASRSIRNEAWQIRWGLCPSRLSPSAAANRPVGVASSTPTSTATLTAVNHTILIL